MTHAWAALIRGAAYLALWIVLIDTDPVDILAGIVTAAAATGVSLRLVPASPHRIRLSALARLLARFVWQSAVAGWDVAKRALDPRLPLAPGFVDYPCRFERGMVRNAFASLTSLMPGTLPIADDGRVLRYHCLDRNQPVLESLSTEEALVADVLDPGAAR
ncbi:MAG TPA: Na+/H+ antiporter subunit E [Burkholderiales bacterium]|nr:Na+/H+ antiporter subunit E [Betaproteobacteria bacterium]HQR51913.1 Na+/H+ antiporter subunit E [Burkholderiales bacterium]